MAGNWIKPLFWLAAAYDLVLGVAFLVAGAAIFARLNVTPPNHWGYVQFSAALVIIFGIAFAVVATNPAKHRDLICMGIGLKLAYAGTVLGHLVGGSIPAVWVWFAGCDLVFAMLFVMAFRCAVECRPGEATATGVSR